MTFTVIPHGEPSSAPNVAAGLRMRLAAMIRPVQDAALVGSGLGVEETEEFSRALQDVVRMVREEQEERRRAVVPDAVATAFRDLDAAEKAISAARRVLAERIDAEEVDPDGSITRGVMEGVGLCMRAQAAIGAARLARS